MKCNRVRAAQTLLEVILAVAFIGIAIPGMLHSFLSAFKSIEHSRRQIAAYQYMETAVTDTRVSGFDGQQYNNTAYINHIRYTLHISTAAYASPHEPVDTDITISWQEGRTQFQESVRTILPVTL